MAFAIQGSSPTFQPFAPGFDLGPTGMAAYRCGGPAVDPMMMQLLQQNNQMLQMFTQMMLMMLTRLMPGQQGGSAGDGGLGPLGGASSAGSSGGGSSAAGSSSSAGATGSAPPLSGNDQQTARQINDFFKSKNSPAASQDVGSLIVQVAKEYDVDPRILVAIAGQETQWGKTGIGVRGMLGVGAYDSNPRNAVNNSKFSGVENQIRVGAKTFANLRRKGGSGPQDSIDKQVEAVNRAGWATDKNWHNGVSSIYRQVAQAVH